MGLPLCRHYLQSFTWYKMLQLIFLVCKLILGKNTAIKPLYLHHFVYGYHEMTLLYPHILNFDFPEKGHASSRNMAVKLERPWQMLKYFFDGIISVKLCCVVIPG